jgi:hypothetical protein
MTLVFDAGALLALEKNDKAMWERWKAAMCAGFPPVTHGGVVGQVWRGGGPRQARLAAALDGIEVYPLDDQLGRRAGVLLKRTGTSDVVDAALVLLAEDGDEIITSDPADITVLTDHADLDVELYTV